MEFDRFLQDNRISSQVWEAAGIEWELLCQIGANHESDVGELTHTAQYCANVLQACPAVHSVRWRIKDTQHLLEKIIRKRAAGAEKYLEITAENYKGIVTDLVGIRALHLFKDDYLLIDAMVRRQWDLQETPLIYHRGGDDVSETDLDALEFTRREHAAGYRSVHYVFGSSPGKQQVLVELQVRTIFEEGWSEIDHRVRYPNYSDNALIGYFLGIFNRMAGSADEMGAYVRNLAKSLAENAEELQALRADYDQTLGKLEVALRDLRDISDENDKSQDAMKRAENELATLRQQTTPALASESLRNLPVFSNGVGAIDLSSFANSAALRRMPQYESYMRSVLDLNSINAAAEITKSLRDLTHLLPKKPDGI